MDLIVIFDIIRITAFVVQLVICFVAKQRWLRLLPVILLTGLVGVCHFFYFYGGFANWGWLILRALISMVLLSVVGAWMVYGLYRLVKKVFHF